MNLFHHRISTQSKPKTSSKEKVDYFKNPILAPDAFEEGNMANISPNIKVNISTNPEVVQVITLGPSCSPEEVASYKALF